MTDEEPFDIGVKLKQRLETTKLQKETTQTKINELNHELQTLFSKIPKRPRESVTEMEEKINALEFKRTTTSMSLADEKSIIREVDKIKNAKLQLEEYNSYERMVQEKKGQLTDLREMLKTTTTAIDELEAALSKVKLATKLGCNASELTHRSIDVSTDKIGRVIGKNGSTIKQLESEQKVAMDVDSVAGKIHLTGTEAAIALAITEIEKICTAIDVDVKVPIDLLSYFTTKRINALTDFRNHHTDVQIEASRDKGVISLRGPPDAVQLCKNELLHFTLKSETRILVGRESAIVVGRSGATINRLVESHRVTIDVSETGEDVFTCTIIGPTVDAAVAEIDAIIQANKDVTEEVVVDQIVRNTLLTDNGIPIKHLQKQVNDAVKDIAGGGVQLTFSKGDSSNVKSVLIIKGRQAVMETAKEMVLEFLVKVQASLVTIDVDPFIVAKIIGKGGEIIKKLKNGKVVNIEVDKVLGRVVIQSQDDCEVKRVEAEVRSIMAENQIVRIQLPAARPMFRDLVRSEKKDEINALVWMGLDDDTSSIVLRGTRENVDKVAVFVNEFIAENYIQEVEISSEDEATLLAGGNESPIQKFQSEYGADMTVVRSRFVVTVKGQKEKVQAAVKRLNQFLHGGDGYTVSRISVTEQALGVVIGKAGAKRAELEKKYEGVHLYIHRSNRIAIRGPDIVVEACRIEILRLVSSVKIQQVMNLTSEEHEILAKPDVIKRATHGIPVQVTLTDDAVKIRGIFADVRDAQAMLKEQLLGVYEAVVELEASQLSCVRRACRDPSHFERIHTTTGAEVKLDMATNSIIISGKRGNVRKAKNLVVGFLEFLIPADFARLEVSKPLHTTVGDPAALAEVAAISGANVFLDRDLSAILIQSADAGKVKKASDILKAKIENADKLAFVVSVGASEAWLIPLIIGKGGIRINSLRLETGCNIEVNKVDRSVSVTGDDEANVAKARELLNAMVDDARRQCVFVELPAEAIAAFLGRGGAHIRSFAVEHNVECDRMRKSPTKIKITGEEEQVKAAKHALDEWIEQWEMKQAGRTIAIDKPSIPAVLGKGGSVIAALQKEYGIKVEINRDELTLTVKGSTDELRDKAIDKINQIITEDQERANARREKSGIEGDHEVAKENGSPGELGVANGNGHAHAKSLDSLSTADSRKDRSGEFARRPVGLTIVEKEASKPKKKRNRNKAKPKDFSDDSTLQVGSSAGRSLFNLLVSDSSADPDHEKRDSPVSNNPNTVSLLVNEEQWDSSTVSSAAIDSSDQDDETGKNAAGAKPYIKSASGFTVRV